MLGQRLTLAFVLLEPSDGKLSRSVPRGLGAGNCAWLPSRPYSKYRRVLNACQSCVAIVAHPKIPLVGGALGGRGQP